MLYLYCSGSEYNVKCVRPALKMEASKEEQEVWFVSLWLRMLRRAIKSKRSGMLSDGIILVRNNSRPNTATLVTDKLQRFGWKTLQNPPYRPDLAPSDFHIFSYMNKRHSLTWYSFGRGSVRVGEVVDPSATYLFLQNWN